MNINPASCILHPESYNCVALHFPLFLSAVAHSYMPQLKLHAAHTPNTVRQIRVFNAPILM